MSAELDATSYVQNARSEENTPLVFGGDLENCLFLAFIMSSPILRGLPFASIAVTMVKHIK